MKLENIENFFVLFHFFFFLVVFVEREFSLVFSCLLFLSFGASYFFFLRGTFNFLNGKSLEFSAWHVSGDNRYQATIWRPSYLENCGKVCENVYACDHFQQNSSYQIPTRNSLEQNLIEKESALDSYRNLRRKERVIRLGSFSFQFEFQVLWNSLRKKKRR